MSAIGPSSAPNDHAGLLTKCTQSATIAAGDLQMSTYFNAGICRRIVPLADGTVSVSRSGDNGVFTAYPVSKGVPLDGEFVSIGGTGNGVPSSAITVNLEL